MHAPGPAAGAAHAFYKFAAGSLDAVAPGFWLLGGENPAEPFIARERGNILPRR